MAFRVQRKPHDGETWEDVGEAESLDDALRLATQTERRAPIDQARPFDVEARVRLGRRVIWQS